MFVTLGGAATIGRFHSRLITRPSDTDYKPSQITGLGRLMRIIELTGLNLHTVPKCSSAKLMPNKVPSLKGHVKGSRSIGSLLYLGDEACELLADIAHCIPINLLGSVK